jgi:hypothetical protein
MWLHLAFAQKFVSSGLGSLTLLQLHRLLPIGVLNLSASITSTTFSCQLANIASTADSLSAFREACGED